MENISLDDRIDAAEANWADAESGSPVEGKWGFFSYGDAPAAIGGGVGMFTWFPDRESMLNFIAETLPYSPPGQSGLDPICIAQETLEIINQIKAGNISDNEGIKLLNKALETCSQLEWMGTVEDLLAGNHPYAVKVRECFREEDCDDEHGGPITDSEKDGFFEFLDTWGI